MQKNHAKASALLKSVKNIALEKIMIQGLFLAVAGIVYFQIAGIKSRIEGIEVFGIQMILHDAQTFTEVNILKQNAVRISSRL